MTDQPMRLNLGCGPVRPTGWCNVDPYPQDYPPERVIVADPLVGLPWGPETFDGAVAHHTIMMIDFVNMTPWLSEVRRVMRPGAVLRISTPDILGAFDAYDENRPEWFPIPDTLADSLDGKLCLYLSQCGATRSLFTPSWLADTLSAAGFRDVVEHDDPGITCGAPWLLDLDSRWDESTYMEALA